MSDEKTRKRNSFLNALLGERGKAEQIREDVAEVEEKLDAVGVEHKSLSAPEFEALLATALQAVRAERVQKAQALTQDDFIDLIIAAHQALADVPAEGQREAVMAMVAEMFADDTAEIEMALFGEDEEVPAAPTSEDEEEDKATEKALPDFLRKLVDDQADMTDALIETAEIATKLEAADLPGQIKALREDMARMLKMVEGAPRRASDAAATRVPSMEALEKALGNSLGGEEIELVAGIPVRVKRGAGNGA